MSELRDIKQVINLWPTRAELVEDISQVCGPGAVNVAQVHKWAQSGAIPARFHAAVIRAGKRRGFQVTAELMVLLHAADRRPVLEPFANRGGAAA